MSSTASPKKIWTILDLITWGTEYLTEKNISDARLTIELMLARVLRFTRIQLYTKFDQPLSETELSHFKEFLKRRIANEPIQYILGETEFMGLPFIVDKRVLIPRQETEHLVEKTVELIKRRFPGDSVIHILDIGTGSGCIAISLAKMITAAQIIAIDISTESLDLAKQNAEKNGIDERIRFHQTDIFLMVEQPMTRQFHCIISNPPYISINDYSEVSKEIKDFEPKSALTDNGNGLKFFPAIARIAKDSLIENGFVGVEHAYDQSEQVQKIFCEHGFVDPLVVKDYQGIKRDLFFTM